jgi:hypothetical protein
VNAAALEQLLDRLDPGDRMQVIQACVRDPDQILIGISQEQAELMRSPGRYGPPSRIRPVGGKLHFDTAELQQLWDAVEPTGPHGAA